MAFVKETAVRERPIVITKSDAVSLRALLAARAHAEHDQGHLHELAAELERAFITEPDEVTDGVITMHARVQVLDLVSNERHELVLVFPREADLSAGRISVLAPLGTALLGYREGDEVEWLMPGGLRRLRVERVRRPTEVRIAQAQEVLGTLRTKGHGCVEDGRCLVS
jgi:regulator of nucleoside diphosphate kinase